jgi:hypothetical protein
MPTTICKLSLPSSLFTSQDLLPLPRLPSPPPPQSEWWCVGGVDQPRAGVAGAEPQAGNTTGAGQSVDRTGGRGRPAGRRRGQLSFPAVSDAAGGGGSSSPALDGTEAMERMRALHTPLQHTTVGSGRRLKTQTCTEDI